MNAEVTGEILRIDGGQSPDTEIPASHFRQGRTCPPFPFSAGRLRDRSGRRCPGALLAL